MNGAMSSDIAMVVQTAIGPIFLLVAVGGLLGVMTQRLGRVVDRVRVLEDGLEHGETGEERVRHVKELRALARRITYANRATNLCTVAALLICTVVATLFLGEITGLPIRNVVAALFVLTMLCLIAGLAYFLAEVRVATRMLRVRGDLFETPASRH